jgi:hypothetical protein
MWYNYSFKLAYAQDNSFELRVNANWTCSEFVEKVTAVARIIFPSVSITDVMHVTESWNQINNPNYNNIPTEENTPIPHTPQTIAQRYPETYFRKLYFYVYFQNECQHLQIRHSHNQSRTIEQIGISIDHYYDIWSLEIDNNRNIQRMVNTNTNIRPYILPTGSSDIETNDRGATIQWGIQPGWTGMNSQYSGGLSSTSQPVSLDDMLTLQHQERQSNDLDENDILLPRDLLNDYVNEINDRENSFFTNTSDIFNINSDIFNTLEPETEYIPRITETHDCCICFTDQTPCFTLENCNHTVCIACYTGVFTRLNNALDLRCPICRTPDSFTSDVYHQITGTYI